MHRVLKAVHNKSYIPNPMTFEEKLRIMTIKDIKAVDLLQHNRLKVDAEDSTMNIVGDVTKALMQKS
jgi:hypothetical protein